MTEVAFFSFLIATIQFLCKEDFPLEYFPAAQAYCRFSATKEADPRQPNFRWPKCEDDHEQGKTEEAAEEYFEAEARREAGAPGL
ncbi:hypothetical protein M0534_01855 [Methylonatrum kenyense]|uniref:hypothetical protein n=1 Tax=Methylonatrum kenyense TaxID=455253 RepID=UPI0020BDAEA5|nr:hypothetical protein [Methylonatrum kenyense]MCK8515077.1 hypothetical protein [Methylonatrum kenyense]